jgi:ATP phosphoribosyltransferase regulatory subunit
MRGQVMFRRRCARRTLSSVTRVTNRTPGLANEKGQPLSSIQPSGNPELNRNPVGPEASRPFVPQGVADYFWNDAYARRHLESHLLELFRTWGYRDVIPPLFEYAETFERGAGGKLRAETYRFLDRDGSTLALRPDMTIPVARLVGVRLHDHPMPQRYCYAGSVFRYTAPQAGRQREFTQTGIELIGASGAAADAEVIALAIEAVRTAGITDFRLVLGQIAYFDALLHELQLTPAQTTNLLHAIDRNSQADLADFLRDTPLRTQQRHTIEGLPHLAGSDATAIIDHAERLSLNYAMHRSLANLRSIVQALDTYGLSDYVYLDMSEINNLGYYTGISFEVLVPGLGFPVGSGGRYDNLIGAFGTSQPAVGVALGIDRLLVARRQSNPLAHLDASNQPALLIDADGDPACLQIVQNLRKQGLRVIVTVDDLSEDELRLAVHHQGARYGLVWTGLGFKILTTGTAPVDAPTFLPQAEVQRIVALVQENVPA